MKLFLSLGVVLCRFNPCAFIALLDTLNNNDIDLLRYAQIEIADVLGGQVCHFTCQMDGGCPELVNASAITLSESIRLRCEQDVSFAPAGARYLRYLAYNGDTKTLLDVFSGCTYHNEVLAATFVDAMMDVRDDVALVDVASDLLFEMLFDGKQAERIMPDWKRMLLQRISAQQTRIDAALYFSPECSALRVVMESENFVSLIKAHELLSRVKPENLIGQVTSLQEILFVQDYFALDVQTTLLNIQEPSLKERYLCQLASSC